VKRIADGVPVPVTADMEAGYGSGPDEVAETVRQTLKAGAVGINIEDSDKANPGQLIEFDRAIERIRAARGAASAAGIPMVINARTDGFHSGDSSAVFDDAVRRANAYLAAGADCAFVPFVRDAGVIGRLASMIEGPMNVLAGPGTPPIPELAKLGVKRVTVGSNITKAALVTIRRAAEELQGPGSYEFARGAPGQPEVHRILAKPGG
jgi:2-methylisocitrate lyase-like PEP mutase family enzyme